MNQSELFIFCLYPYVLTGSVFAQDKRIVINPCDTLVNSGNDFSAIVLDEAVCMIILISNRNSKEWFIKDVDFMIFWFNEYITFIVFLSFYTTHGEWLLLLFVRFFSSCPT